MELNQPALDQDLAQEPLFSDCESQKPPPDQGSWSFGKGSRSSGLALLLVPTPIDGQISLAPERPSARDLGVKVSKPTARRSFSVYGNR